MPRTVKTNRLEVLADVLRRHRITPDDPEFEEILEGYMAGEVDPEIARHHQTDLPDDVQLNYQGFYQPEGTYEPPLYGVIANQRVRVPSEPGTVNAVHTMNTPTTWSHEYRHKNYPRVTEYHNRLTDVVAAQTDYDLDQSLRNLAKGKAPSEGFEHLDNQLYRLAGNYLGQPTGVADVIQKELLRENPDLSKDELRDKQRELVESSMARELIDDAKALEKWNKGVKKRNEARKAGKPESLKDYLRVYADLLRY